jgi:hypothetical protein
MTLSERTLWRSLTCALEYRQARQRSNSPGRLDWIDQTVTELSTALAAVSPSRQSSKGDQEHLNGDEEQVGSREVAAMIGWNMRKVQRRADELGGDKRPDGRFVFRASAVREHIEGGKL